MQANSSRAPLYALLAAAAVALAGCESMYHRTPAQREADRSLAAQVSSALNSDTHIYARHIDVRADNGVVHLSGYVWSDRDLYEAKEIAARVAGVTNVVDDLELERGGTDDSPVSR